MARHLWFRFIGRFRIHVLLFLCFLVQVEAQLVSAFMTNRQVWEDEVAGFVWSIKVSHTGDRHASEYWNLRWSWMNTAMCHGSYRFQGCKQEKVGVVGKGNIIVSFLSFHNAQLDDWWRIDRSSIRGGCQSLAKTHP
jgi:hypothetical protein